MSYTLRLVTAPAIEPVSLAEAKAHVRQDGSADDALLTRLIVAARSYIETETGLALIDQTHAATFGEWPKAYSVPEDDLEYSQFMTSARYIPHLEIVKLPFGLVTGITAAGVAWTEFTTVLTARGIRIKPTGTIPAGEIIVTFTAGYGETASLVPSDLSHAILMLVATLYDNPGALALDTSGLKAASVAVPGFAGTLQRYKVIS